MGYRVADNTYGIAEFQTELLKLLGVYAEICKKYNLRWFVIGGTCIGALRHGGFVPWDDDLDVAMPRHDYEKLWSKRDEINKNSQFIVTRTTKEKNYHHRVMQLVDLNTTFVHARSANEDVEHGVYIDIIPMDGCAPTKLGYYRQVLNAMAFSVYNIQCLPEYNDGKLISVLTFIALKLIPNKYLRYKIWKHCEKQMSKWDWDKSEIVALLTCDVKSILHPYKGEWFKQVKKHIFENTAVNIPIRAEKYLTQYYGDFMQLPPEEYRHPVHNTKMIDLKCPYVQYRGIYYLVEEKGHN